MCRSSSRGGPPRAVDSRIPLIYVIFRPTDGSTIMASTYGRTRDKDPNQPYGNFAHLRALDNVLLWSLVLRTVDNQTQSFWRPSRRTQIQR